MYTIGNLFIFSCRFRNDFGNKVTIQLYQTASLLCVTLTFIFILCFVGQLAQKNHFQLAKRRMHLIMVYFSIEISITCTLLLMNQSFHLPAWEFIDGNFGKFRGHEY